MTSGLARGLLIGRDAELDRIVQAVRRAENGTGGAMWIEGEPGIGKSALLDTALSNPTTCQIFRAAADELGFPLQAILDCFEPLAPAPESVVVATERLLDLIGRLAAQAPVVLVE